MNKNLSNVLKGFMLLISFSFFQKEIQAQSFDNGIFFQALARDNYANPAKDRKIYVQATIIQSSINGTKVLVEEFQTSTDASGVFGISIGKGNRTGGSFSNLNSIDWSAGPYFLNLQISITPVAPLESWNYAKDWIDLGTTSFGTVPYALYAKSVAGFDTKVNVSDTAKMLLPYAKAQALTLVQNAVNTKLNTADSVVKYVTRTQLANSKFDTTSLSNRIDLKANALDVLANTNNISANTTSITANAAAIANNTNDIILNSNNIASNTTSITANMAAISLKADLLSLATVATSGSFNDLTNKPTGYVTSVGSVSGSSNANGAVITSGALNLTPADGTNGGIISNGTQTIAGNKTLNGTTTFANNIYVKGLGLGLGTGSQSTYFGNAASAYGNNSTAIGFMSQNGNTGLNNTSIGSNTLRNTNTGSYNTVVGSEAGQVIASYNTFIGASTNGAAAVSNATALGYGAYLTESNSIQLGANGYNGTTPITKVKTSGTITAGAITYPNTGGSNGQVLTTNGSVASWVTPSTITVGTISNTSNVNGATISAGVLSLAPADASNGGIVTTGAQNFVGNKTFSGNIVVNTVTNPATKDVDNFVGIVGTIGATQWQSFVAGQSGRLTKITLSGNGSVGARNGTLIIFAGTGISGTQLSSQTVALPPSSGSYDLVLTSPVNLISGQTYTFEVIDPIGFPSGNASFGGAALISGTSYYSNAYGLNPSTSSYSWGLQFQTWISTTSGGNLSTTGAITSGDVTYPKTNGTAGQVLTANSNGQASWTSVSGGSGPQIVTTSQRDALNTTTSGVMIFNSTLNKYQGSIYYTTGYNYNNFTSTIYGFSEVRPGYSLAQTFTGKGQVITSANIAVVNMGRVSNTGTFTFAIYDDTYNYAIFTTTITLSGAGTVAVTIPNNWMNMPTTLPNGPCSIRISSDASTGGSADFLLNAGASVGSLSNTYWTSLGGSAAGYTTPDTGHQLAIDLLPQNGLTWVSFN